MTRTNRNLRATHRRLLALWTLIDQPTKSLDHVTLNESAQYVDPRVLLLSMAECAIHGLVEMSEGVIKITDRGVIYAQQNIDSIKDREGNRITWDYLKDNLNY